MFDACPKLGIPSKTTVTTQNVLASHVTSGTGHVGSGGFTGKPNQSFPMNTRGDGQDVSAAAGHQLVLLKNS